MYLNYPKNIKDILKKYFGKFKNEIEQYHIEEGEIFGDFGLIKEIPRTASAFVKEESYVICIDKNPFEEYFLRPILRSENERKNFIKINLEVLTGTHRFNEYYERMTIYVKDIINSIKFLKNIFFIYF
jgi:CRP-like cAMP-binding protein